MTGFTRDVRYAFRLLCRQPSYALFVILTLGVGIGANTAIFSVVNAVLLRPLPYPDADRLVRVWGRFDPESGFDFARFSLSNPEYLDYGAHARALDAIGAFANGSVTVGGDATSDPERVRVSAYSASMFDVLGIGPALGRGFSVEETLPGGNEVALLSHGYWQTRFGGAESILGRDITVNGRPTQVIGVMPDGFDYPGLETRLWLPLRIDPANPGGRSSHSLRVVGRLAPGVGIDAARAELAALMTDWKARFPDIHTGHYLFLEPLLETVAGDVRPALLILLGATGLVLLIVCANVASLVLARGEGRTREMAIRGALGAGGWRLVRLSLAESTVLAAAGGAVGLALAYVGVRALLTIDPDSIPRSAEVGLDPAMAMFAAGAAGLAAVLFGLAPALRAARADLQQTLRESSLSTTGNAARLWFRRTLVAVEVALCVVLMLGAGLMARGFTKLTSVDPGFRAPGLVSAGIALPAASYDDAARVDQFYADLIARLSAVPGVESVSAGSTVPMWNDAGNWDFVIEGRPVPPPGQPAWNAKAVIVRPGYLETLGIPLIRGRSFSARDDARSQLVVVVNEALARSFFAGEDPIGRRIRIAGGDGSADRWMTIVGIADNARTDGLDAVAPPSYYFLQSQFPRSNGTTARALAVFARASGDPGVVMRAIRTHVRAIDPTLAVSDVQTSGEIIARSVARPRFTASLLGLFAAIGLVLGMSGIYAVLSYTVSRRTHELGIRRALGAQPSALAWQVLGSGMVPVAAGLVAGLTAAYWLAGLLRTYLFGVSPVDPATYAVVTTVVALVATLAMASPVRRALRINPIVALRSE